MNTERLHALLQSLSKEFTERKTAEKISDLSTAVANLVTLKTAEAELAFDAARKAVKSALTNSISDEFSPTWKQVLEEIGGGKMCGLTFWNHIEEAIHYALLTPTVCTEEILKIAKSFQDFALSVENGIAAFQEFGIGAEELEAGECEIGILIPREAVDGKLHDFGKELQTLTHFFDAISEVSTGKKDPLHIRSISSSEFLIFLVGGLMFCKCLSETLGSLVELYKKVLDLKQSRNDYLKKGVPETIVKQVEDHANAQMKENIHDLAIKVVTGYYQGETGRKNELIVSVEKSLGGFADRIDRGYNIEIRVEPITYLPDENESEKAKQKRVEFQKAVETIKRMAPNMQYLKTEGTPILRLSEEKKSKGSHQSEQPKQDQTVKKKTTKKVVKKSNKPAPAD